MTSLRLWMAINLGWFFVFFNIERLNQPVDISFLVYVLVPIAIVIIAAVPTLAYKSAFYGFTGIILTVYIASTFATVGSLLGTRLPLTVFEIVLIVVSLILFKRYIDFVRDFEDIVSQLTFRQLGLPPRLYQTLDNEDLYREVRRSRKYQHPLTMLILKPQINELELPESKIMQELRSTLAKRFVDARLVSIISENLRDMDMIVQYDEGFALMLPETDSVQAQRIISHIQDNVYERVGLQLQIGNAAFPENAITLNGLIDNATKDLKRQQATVDLAKEKSDREATTDNNVTQSHKPTSKKFQHKKWSRRNDNGSQTSTASAPTNTQQ